MTPPIAAWLVTRLLRWLAWLSFLGFALYYYSDPRPHINIFGQLRPMTEFIMFGSGLAALFLGFLELMMRERTGLPRPAFGRNWLG